MKAIIKGHYICERKVTWLPCWYNKIGETIDVYNKHIKYIGDKNENYYNCSDNRYINENDIILLSELRKQKLERILNNE
jgi:hypothetical protein